MLLAALVVSGAGVATAGGAAGAAGRSSPQSSSAGVECPTLNDDPDDPEGALVVLVDGTTSSVAQTDRVDDLARLVDATTTDRTVAVTVGSFGGSDAEVRFSPCLDGDAFVAKGNNARTRERNRGDLIDGLHEVLAALPSGYESSDPTSALRAGVERLTDSDAATRVLVMHTDGIPTTGCAALPAQVTVDEPGLVERMASACVDAGQIPAADGVDIVIAGIGRTDTDLGADAVTFLLALNTALCEASGATCHVDANLPTTAWPTDPEED
jgi:hypothetical protein